MFEPLNRSLETFITKLSKSTERGERSRRTLKKPKSYKDESDGCIDTWIEVMKLHFEEENLSKKQECSALTSNLEGTALSCVMAKRANERDSARKIFDILLNRFGSGVQGHQAMVKFEKRRQRDEESIDKFLDDLELLRRRSNPDERISERNLAIASKFMDGVRSEELKTMLATHFTLSLDQVPTPDDLRMKSREYLLKTVTAIMATIAGQTLVRIPVGTNLAMTWTRGGRVRIVVRWTITFLRVLHTNRT